jgi:hypothetical protein
MKIYVMTTIILIVNYMNLIGQNLPTESLFDFASICQQKNIRISERIREENGFERNILQTTYYNANKDYLIDSTHNIEQVLLIAYYPNGTKKIIELIDDGYHFDKSSADGIFGNFFTDDINNLQTDQTIIDIRLDTLGIEYVFIYPPVKFLSENPEIFLPTHNSIVFSQMPVISWTIDPISDGCGVILVEGNYNLGEELKNIIWEGEYRSNSQELFIEKIPINLSNQTKYKLIVWAYTDTKEMNGNWFRGSYSMEWCEFLIDTSRKNEKIELSQNFPNPFNTRTIIRYNIPERGKVSLKIYDINGKEIANLIQIEQAEGEHYIYWNGTNNEGTKVSSGVYFCNLKFNNFLVTRKMLITR